MVGCCFVCQLDASDGGLMECMESVGGVVRFRFVVAVLVLVNTVLLTGCVEVSGAHTVSVVALPFLITALPLQLDSIRKQVKGLSC